MKNINKSIKVLALFVIISLMFTSCSNGKKFDSPEEMISELAGTYEGTGEHSGERVVITNDSIIKFNINNIYKTPKEQSFFEENYGTQDWNTFDLDTLLSKDYVSIVKEPVSADINNSSLSGLWVDKDGTVFSQREEGYELKKVSEETNFPTDEIKRRFDSYCKRLKEYEHSSVISNADIYVTQKKTALDTVLSSDEKAESQKCTASAETVAKCAFESIKGIFDVDHTTFEIEDYSKSPQKDSYGRVLTYIKFKVSYKNNEPTSLSFIIVLQSCSPSGEYTYRKGKVNGKTVINYLPYDFFSDPDDIALSGIVEVFLKANNWEVDPNADSAKESSYSEALELAKDGKYESAIKKLEKLDGYKKSNEISAACNECLLAEKYSSAISLFKEEKYDEAKSKLADFESNTDIEFWKTKADRAIYLCDYNNAASNPEQQPSSDNSTSDNESGNSSVATTKANTTSSVSKKNETDIKPAQSSSNSDTENEEPVESNPQTAQSTTKKVPDENKPSAANTTKATTKAPATEKPVEDPCANGHSWVAQTKTVHHDETGHYETVVDAKEVTKYRCPLCGYGSDNEYSSLDAYYKHFDAKHGDDSLSSTFRDSYEEVERWEEYETKEWIVDSEAYDETVITGYKCSVCGAKK